MYSFFNDLNDKAENIIQPLWDKIVAFLGKGYYVLYATITVFVALLTLIGLFTFLKKTPKLFLLVLFLLALVVVAWYLFVIKKVGA